MYVCIDIRIEIFCTKFCFGFQARQAAEQKKQAAEESRKDYLTSLNQFNQDQNQHYHTLVPVIYQVKQQYHTLILVIYQVTAPHTHTS